MADNSTQSGADTIRDRDRAGVKTQVVGLDLTIGGAAETLMDGSMPISVPTAIESRASTFSAAAATALSTELNALAAGSYCAPSAAIDNSAVLDLYDDLELTVTFATAPTANTLAEVYLIPSLDGTNYADAAAGTTTAPSPNLYVGGFPVRAVTTAQRLVFRGVPLPPGLFKYQIRNGTNQAFPATGSVMRRRSYSLQLG